MSECRIEPGKICDYLLNPDHEAGGPKNAFFEAHGFHRSRPQQLVDALVQHFAENEISDRIATPFGIKLIVLGRMATPDGRRPVVKSVWIASEDEPMPRFVTAVPR